MAGSGQGPPYRLAAMEHEEGPETSPLARREGVLADDGAATLKSQTTTKLDPEGDTAGFHPAMLAQDTCKERPLGWQYGSSQWRGSARVASERSPL